MLPQVKQLIAWGSDLFCSLEENASAPMDLAFVVGHWIVTSPNEMST